MLWTPKQTSAYISGAYALMRALKDNNSDHQLVEGGNRFFYFVDANMAVWYGNPHIYMESISLLAPGTIGTKRAKTLEFVTAAVTVEYIFSKQLPGSYDSPCFLMPDHGNEVLDKLVKFSDEVRAPEVTDDDDARSKVALEKLERVVATYNADPKEEGLFSVYDAFATLVEVPKASKGLAAARMAKLVNEHKVARAETYKFIVSDESDGARELSRLWEARIRKVATPGKIAKDRNLQSDARALAQLVRLNESAGVQGQNIYYVLITNDYSLHSAVDAWSRECEAKGTPFRTFLRHPRQFVPIMNLYSYSSQHPAQSHWFRALWRAVEDLLLAYSDRPLFGGNEPERHFYEEMLPEIERTIHTTNAERLAEKARVLQESWTMAIRAAALMNAAPLLERGDTTVKDAVDLISTPDVEKSFGRALGSGIRGIARAHVSLAIQGRIANAIEEGRAKSRDVDKALPSRGPMLFWFTIGPEAASQLQLGFGGPDSVNQTLEWLFNLENPTDAKRLEELLLKLDRPEAYAAAAAVSYRAGLWHAARHFADRALQLLEDNSERQLAQEVKYCRWVANRFLIDDLFELQTQRRDIFGASGFYRRENDMFRYARANSELGALLIFFPLRRIVFKDLQRGPSLEYLEGLVRDADRALRLALSVISISQPSIGTPLRDLWDRVKLQALNNICFGHIIRRTVFGGSLPADITRARTDAQELRVVSNKQQRWRVGLSLVNVAVLDALLAEPDRKIEFRKRAVEAIGELEKFAIFLHEVDKAYLRWVGARI